MTFKIAILHIQRNFSGISQELSEAALTHSNKLTGIFCTSLANELVSLHVRYDEYTAENYTNSGDIACNV